jgi:hypothetical protein
MPHLSYEIHGACQREEVGWLVLLVTSRCLVEVIQAEAAKGVLLDGDGVKDEGVQL